MEEDIDLRPYIEALVSKWYWIVGVAIMGGLAAFIASSLLPPHYEATALVALTQPNEIVEFDARIRSSEDIQPLKAFPEIALSDELLIALLTEVSVMDSKVQSVEEVRKLLTATNGADPSLLHLTVNYGDPKKTAEIANVWADIFVAYTNQIYGNQGGEQLVFFQEQLDNAKLELETAEEALIEFQARNRSRILANQLNALQQKQANQLKKQEQIESILQDIGSLLIQLENVNDAVYVDQLTALLLQMRAFGGSSVGETAVPWQIQVDFTQAEDISRSEQTAILEGVQNAISDQLASVETALAEMEPKILEVQQSKQEAGTESIRLERSYTLAEATYLALASKVEEERITSQDINSGVKLVSRTAVPDEPTNIGSLMLAIIGAIAGGIVAVFGITAVFWWSSIQTITEA